MRGRTPFKLAIGTAAVALLAAGCSSTPAPAPTDDPRAGAGGELRIYASEPAFLVPTAGDDEPSIYVIRQLYRGLVKYNAETGAAGERPRRVGHVDGQQHLDDQDQARLQVHNGEAGQLRRLHPRVELRRLRPERPEQRVLHAPHRRHRRHVVRQDPDGDGPQTAPDPKAKELSGLKKVDDLTFTVKLTAPFSGFPATIGYSGFFPMAKACLDDFDACNETPIGNGPYKIEGSWKHDVEHHAGPQRRVDRCGQGQARQDHLQDLR